MANNLDHESSDQAWKEAALDSSKADIEIFVIRKDGMGLLMEKDLPIPPEYIRAMLAALIGLPKLSIQKITVCIDGSKIT